MAVVSNHAPRIYWVGDASIKPLASAEVPDEIVRRLMSTRAFAVHVERGDLSIVYSDQTKAVPAAEPDAFRFSDVPESAALVLVAAEESTKQLRQWAKKEKRIAVLDAIEARLISLA